MDARTGHDADSFDADVAIVGYGPVGQALATMLGSHGHRVLAFERFDEIYPLPRAVHLDHEIMRILQSLGIAEEVAERMTPVRDYEWFGADRKPLLTLTAEAPARSGWEPDYMFFQPALEAALDSAARALDTVTVERGWEAERLVDTGEAVELTVCRVRGDDSGNLQAGEETRTVRVPWVVGADGANSFVRESTGITRRDLGFQERWLVVDAVPHDMGMFADLPMACQWCDPARPTTQMQSCPTHRRWEFMLLPGEEAGDFDEARVWSLLEPWYRPEDGALTRSAVYEFRSMLANEMRRGRALLVGDAAHLTPPFLGQGMCAGVRDAANLAWKLDLVLRGVASEDVLDTVGPERQGQNEWVINFAIGLGKVLCELDPEAAAERDENIRQADAPPPRLELVPLADGIFHRGEDGVEDPLAGTLGIQGLVAAPEAEGRFDDAVGRGFTLIANAGDPRVPLDAQQLELLDELGVTVASLDPDLPGGVRDLDGRLTAWLAEHEAYAVLVRPDFYVFGSAPTEEQLPSLIDDLAVQLGTPRPAGTLN